MSHRLISHSPDLKRLRDEGYEVEIRHGHLLLNHVPYVDQQRQVKRGTLVSTLTLAGDQTATPDTHVAMFVGELPCDRDGQVLTQILHSSGHQVLAEGLEIDHL